MSMEMLIMCNIKIVVIADDITGAAEIAGIASDMYLSTAMLMADGSSGFAIPDKCQVCVIATDTRSMSVDNAVCVIENVCHCIANQLRDGKYIVFKKVDSVLRGNILAELQATMSVLNIHGTLLLAQNPSKGRIISGGHYTIDGKPLQETAFGYDPEFPANTNDAGELLSAHYRLSIRRNAAANFDDGLPLCIFTLPVDDDIDETSVTFGDITNVNTLFIADATTIAEVNCQLAKRTDRILLAGGADLFRATAERFILQSSDCYSTLFSTTLSSLRPASEDKKLLIICGSTQSQSLISQPLMQVLKTVEYAMPDDVFNGNDPSKWISLMVSAYLSNQCLIMSVGNHEKRGGDYARRLRCVMAEASDALVSADIPSSIVIEGGATAFRVLSNLKWRIFRVICQLEPGIVALQLISNDNDNVEESQPIVVLKPGSYNWGNVFHNAKTYK